MKQSTPAISVVIPCKNEAGHITTVIEMVPAGCEIICVDNNSRDDTTKVLADIQKKHPNMTVLNEPRENRGIGYGYAYMTGIQRASGQYIVCADGDGTYPLQNITLLIQHMQAEDIDMLSCSRYPVRSGSSYSRCLKAGTRILQWITKFLYSVTIQDIVSGMWIIRKDTYQKLTLSEGGWNFSLQIKLQVALHPDSTFQEYPIVQYKRYGKSKQRYVRTGVAHVWWLIKHSRGL